MHAELHINDDCVLYFYEFSDPQYKIGKNFSLVLDMESEEEINRIYDELAKDGNVKMPMQDTFWGAKHGVIVDKNGIQWDLNFTKE
ncbi:VOC family protein [Bacillus sp. CGMCC 1.16607]|uniref:VOC family protein n=1 Tax=Bacillus sp. CGMCC 1.16607 TaxID=3351842 RepID=UPI0036445886